MAKNKVWDNRWMDLCEFVSGWSKDRSRRTSSVIVNKRNVLLSIGWNGFARGINDDVNERHRRPDKYLWTEHAERNAIYNAASEGINVSGAKMYIPWYPCCDCARAIIQSNIAELICVPPDWNDIKYRHEFKITKEMLKEAKVKVRFMKEREAPTRNHIDKTS